MKRVDTGYVGGPEPGVRAIVGLSLAELRRRTAAKAAIEEAKKSAPMLYEPRKCIHRENGDSDDSSGTQR